MTPQQIAENYFKYLERAQLLMEVERWREALHELNQHLSAFPGDYTALCNSAVCLMNLSEFQAALDLTKQAVEANPESEWAYRVQSCIFTSNGEHGRALTSARLAAEKDPSSRAVVSCLFWAEVNHGELVSAERSLARLMELDPGSAEAHEAAGYLALKRGDNLEAEKKYLEALQIDPNSVQALNNLGVVYLNLAQAGKGRNYHKKASEMFERAVRVKPTFTIGQKNIQAASNALKVGAPVSVLLLIWGSFHLFRILAGILQPGTATVQSSLYDLSPISESYVLTAINLYCAVLFAALFATAIFCLNKDKREAIFYQLRYLRGWLILFLPFTTAVISYLAFFLETGAGTPAFSGLAFAVSLLISIFTGMATFRIWWLRVTS